MKTSASQYELSSANFSFQFLSLISAVKSMHFVKQFPMSPPDDNATARTLKNISIAFCCTFLAPILRFRLCVLLAQFKGLDAYATKKASVSVKATSHEQV